jgi:hypothetical protein
MDLSYETVTDLMAYTMIGFSIYGLVALLSFAIHLGLAICYVPRGIYARKVELSTWKAYYAKLDELDVLKKGVEQKKARLQADAKMKVLTPVEYVEEVQIADAGIVEFEKTVIGPLKKAADEATSLRQWYVARTWRSAVM